MRLLILGAGRLGGTLGLRWAAHGHDVVWAVRDASSPQRRELAAHRNTRLVGPGEDPGGTDIVVVATPAGAALDALGCVDDWAGRVVVDCTNPVAFDSGMVSRIPVDEGSIAERIAARIPGARVVKTLNQVGSDIVADPARFDAPPLMYVAGDDAAADVPRAPDPSHHFNGERPCRVRTSTSTATSACC